jgi:hypothetical protein
LAVEDMTVNAQGDKQLDTTKNDDRKTNQDAETRQSSTISTRDAYTDPFRGTCDYTFGDPKTSGGHKHYGAADCCVPRRIGEHVRPASRPMTSGNAEYDIQLPPEGPYDRGSRNVQTDVGAATDTEMAICSTILLGKVDATGSYNVDGHAVSIEELQEQLGNLRDRN